ncbi:MAG: tRNA uridine-5-carboxymethylaminomethyl(34) synthesis GTPase MnmE [Bacilli bacterium]|nr:tRNA uridine-5-carboxymethylaminomethyl(34) synthesis GTPase MnmE [Bacilli bacterium]
MYNYFKDTIASISTALANGAISIVRLSGDDAINIVNSIFKNKDLTKEKSHTITYGHIYDNDEVIDEVLVSVFKAPKTFTREDVVEINCHGGIYVTNKILELVLSKGARLAEPGEFTKRAYLNGRIDLTQAESVMDIIEAKTKTSLKMANYGLSGETKKLISNFKEKILKCILEIEVNIDYPEYKDEIQVTTDILKPNVDMLIGDIKAIIDKAEQASIIKNGIKTAIIGKPNVGKSSLLNALLKEDKAIVTNIAGTTRDIVEGNINVGGVLLHLIDTAGIRDASDKVEQIGVNKSKQVLSEAELVILVFDYSEKLSEIDIELLKETKDKTRIIIVNKNDLNKLINLDELDDYLLISSFNENDIEKVTEKIKEICRISDITDIDSSYIGNSRQMGLLRRCFDSLLEAKKGILNNDPIDLINIDLTNSYNYLLEILGELSTADLVDEMFARFCLGK